MSYPINKITNLCYLINDNSEVLLIFKKRDFGKGKWNGPGGKVEVGESPKASMIREVEEETGLVVLNPLELGYIEFIWSKDNEENNQRTYIYSSKEFSGQLRESDECLPKWFKFDQIPYSQMWPDDEYWYPEMLAGKPIKKRFFFDNDNKIIRFEEIESEL